MRRLLLPACLLLAAPAFARAPRERIAASLVAGSCPAPQWPAIRMCADDLDPVRIAFVIGPDGRVLKARVEHSAGYRKLDDAAVKALSRCRFRAGRIDGKPVPDVIRMQHIWTLD
ncbi:TonB family protein [Massilia violaceinigra]|uniref:TonB family protein n=1 Tax=Massilia violaceinigra TaxID=2045208 RepID=A0ABY4AEZ1_9BURK|nr:energy transducer TonB [Massilia violaceinigra]UOD32715.1 TonB family protein [Massilia violaceinigra]